MDVVNQRFMKSLLTLFLMIGWFTASRAGEPESINAVVGNEFKLELESDFSTGCQWLLYKPLDEKLLKPVGKPQRRHPRPGAKVGYEVLTYKALASGKTVVCLKYDRLWEKTAAPLRVTNILVVISRVEGK
jgi:predicted secreted protein